jgi:hypothetical protein
MKLVGELLKGDRGAHGGGCETVEARL